MIYFNFNYFSHMKMCQSLDNGNSDCHFKFFGTTLMTRWNKGWSLGTISCEGSLVYADEAFLDVMLTWNGVSVSWKFKLDSFKCIINFVIKNSRGYLRRHCTVK